MITSVVGKAIEGRLRVRHLAILTAVAETLSMRGAARAVNLTQSAVSKSIQELEGIVGLRLFDRHRRGLVLTNAGRSLVDRAGALLEELGRIERELAAIASGATGRIHVGILPVVETDLLPESLLRLAAQHPALKVVLEEGTRETLVAALEAGRLDCVVGRLQAGLQTSTLVEHILYEAPVAIVCRRDHPITRATDLTWEMLREHDWILPPSDAPIRQAIEHQFAAAALKPPHVPIESTSTFMNHAMILKTFCLAAMAHGPARILADLGTLTILPVAVEWGLPPVGVLTRRALASPATSAFIAVLKQAAADR